MHDLLPPLSEIAQQLELAVRQVHWCLVAARALRAKVDDELPDEEALERGMRAPQHGADASEQLLQVERLGDVIVGAELQPLHLVGLLAARRQDDDGHLARLPQHRAQIEAVEVGQRQVEHDQIGRRCTHIADGRLAVRDSVDAIAFEDEVVTQHAPEGRVVFDDEDPLCQ